MNPIITRRDFLRVGTLTGAGILMPSRASAAEPKGPLFSAVGIAASIKKAQLIKEAGGQFLTESVADFLVPDQEESAFLANLEKLKACPLPILACNSLIRPAHLRAVGADANHAQVLAWAAIAFRRLKLVGGKFAVFGSSKARELRNGWPKEKAEEQFVSLLKAMGPLAANEGITVVVEQLRTEEVNFINRIGEGAAIIRAAGHPNVRLLADLYHMVSVGDRPEDLEAAMDVVVHVEIAERTGRTLPGVHGDDFRSYFKVLHKAGYQGAISMEGRYTDAQIAPAIVEILKQAADV